MSILRRSIERRYADPNIIPSNSSVTNVAYRYSTVDAFSIAAVVACVGLRAGAFAQIPLKGYQDGAIATLLPQQPELLANPSQMVVPSVWKTQMSISRDVWGYAAGLIQAVDGAGRPSKVDWWSPDDIRAWSEYTGGPLRWRFGAVEIDASLVFHIPSRWVSPGNPLGMSPLEKSGLVDLAKRAQDFGRDWFRNGAVPSAIVYSDRELTQPESDVIVTNLMSKWRARRPAVLGSGLKYEKVAVAANESQFLETLQQTARDIAISFNLPPEKINAAVQSGSITYANREANVQQYLMDSVNPDLVIVSECHERHLRKGEIARWATGAFLRSDLKTRYESYEIGLRAGFLARDEVRAWEELPSIGDTNDDPAVAREVAELIQKVYLGVGPVVSTEEARTIANRAGANLVGALPAPGGAA